MAGKIGRPTKKTPELLDIIVRAVENMCTIDEAAAIAGINPDTVYDWMKKDASFSESVKNAQLKVRGELKRNAFRRAITPMQPGKSGDMYETALTIFLLKTQCGFSETKPAGEGEDAGYEVQGVRLVPVKKPRSRKAPSGEDS